MNSVSVKHKGNTLTQRNPWATEYSGEAPLQAVPITVLSGQLLLATASRNLVYPSVVV